MTTDELVLQKLDTLIAATRAASMPVDVKLWDAEQIGIYLCVSTRQVAERYAMLPDFPRAICLPSSGEGIKTHRRWKAADIIEWTEGRQERRRA
jgi:hypothetical protein